METNVALDRYLKGQLGIDIACLSPDDKIKWHLTLQLLDYALKACNGYLEAVDKLKVLQNDNML